MGIWLLIICGLQSHPFSGCGKRCIQTSGVLLGECMGRGMGLTGAYMSCFGGFPMYRWENWSLAKLSNLSKIVTEQVSRFEPPPHGWEPIVVLPVHSDSEKRHAGPGCRTSGCCVCSSQQWKLGQTLGHGVLPPKLRCLARWPLQDSVCVIGINAF